MNKINLIKNLFKNKDLFDQALTHRSWVNEHKGIRDTNERLEFLGDAILELVVSETLFKAFPQKKEGFLTALRSNLVNTQNLFICAQRLGVGEALYLSKGEEEGGGRESRSLLADTLEAIIGAIYEDSGYQSAEKFIKENILVNVDQKAEKSLKDPKSLLQETIQKNNAYAPTYRVLSEFGPDHKKIFTVEVVAEGKILAKGTGNSKSEAEQKAAELALNKINQKR